MADLGAFNSFLTVPGPHPSSSAQTWELHKPTIEELYVDDGKPLRYVMKTMEQDYNFIASKKVYRKRLAKWGFERKIKRRERERIVRKLIERGAIGKQSRFMLRGRQFSVWEFTFNRKPTQKIIQNLASQESSGAATPPHLRCSTPEPDTWEAASSAEFLRTFAEEMEVYNQRSNGIEASTNGSQLQDNSLPEPVAGNGDPRGSTSEELLQ